MKLVLSTLLAVCVLPLLVSAHGYVGSVTIDGKSYPGNQPSGPTNPSVIRQVSTIDPVKGSSNPSLNCGMGATLAANVASANPGSQLLIHWVGGSTGSSDWPHETGPLMHYMAKCDGSCSSYDSSSAEWFKVSQLGIEPDGNTWYQLSIKEALPANVTIPSDIAPGNYLLRTEIISLQLAVSMGGAEFYVACIQLSIGGSGTGGPKSGETCTFPGGYSDSDPGIYVPNIYNPPLTYTFPGPPVAAFVGSGGSEGGSQPSGGSGSPSATSMPTSASSSPTSSASSGSVPANTYSSPAAASAPSTTPTYTTPTTSQTGTTCYVKRSTDPSSSPAKRSSKREIHKRRLVRRGP